jgi:drug/metabolite transporter (DMT)-like permease
MNSHLRAIPFIVAGVLLNALAQVPLKKGLQAAGGFGTGPLLEALFRILFQPWVLAGLACYAVSVVVWLMALSRVEVAYAYPFLALGFLVNALLARWLLGEAIPPLRWVALALIVAGVALQAFTGHATSPAPSQTGEGPTPSR